MKRLIIFGLVLLVLAGCSQSVMDKVSITNVTVEKERPLGYVPATFPDMDDITWWGEQISGDITNNSSATLTVSIVIHSYGKNKENSRYYELIPIKINPGETKRFQYSFDYEKQGVKQPYKWHHDIINVIAK